MAYCGMTTDLRRNSGLQDLKPLNIVLLEPDTNNLISILDQDKYTCYQDSLEDENYVPGIEEIALILSTKALDMSSKNGSKLLLYFKNGGNVLCPVKNSSNFSAVRGICCQKFPDYQKFWIKQSSQWISPNVGTEITKEFIKSHFSTFCHDNPDETQVTVTCGYLYTGDNFKKFGNEKSIQQSKILLDFNPPSENEVVTEKYLPIYPYSDKIKPEFDWEKYQSQLSTKSLGQIVIYAKVVNSTFDPLEGPKPLKHGLAVIANRQIKGRGRGQNSWLSPEGCAMTSFQLQYSPSSKQGQNSSLLQHLVSLAVVHSLKDLLELNLKWPNDIYYGPNIKMGGVVVLSSVLRDEMTFNIGIGFNLANSEPTLSFNDLLKKQGLSPIDKETYFAKFFNCLEKFLDMLETDDGKNNILQLYHQYWLHQDQKVSVISENNEKTSGTVKCIDEFGYIMVELPNGEMVSLQPGNNSFDMMQGLIMPKKAK